MHLPKLFLLPTLLREMFSKRSVPREPHPDLVMEDAEANAAFTHVCRPGGSAEAYTLFYCARASLALYGAKRVLDLGCGPGTILVHLAALCPDISFVGVDLSDNMLQEARRYAVSQGVQNVEFIKADATRLDFPAGSFDGVMSIMTLHHLPSEEHLRSVFQEISRVLKPDGALFLLDFGRLKSPFSMLTFAYEKVDEQPILLTRDFERCLRAAFRLEDQLRAAQELLPSQAKVVSTFKIPIMVVIKTEDRPIPAALTQRLRDMADRLSSGKRRDLDDLRMFLQLGGLENDPFGSGFRLPLAAYRRMARQLAAPPLGRLVTASWRRWLSAVTLMGRLGLYQVRIVFWTWVYAQAPEAIRIAKEKDQIALSTFLQRKLGALKGPLMKFGQMASYVDDRLSPGVRELLASLQDRSPALDPRTIRACVEKSLGRPIEEAFAEWEDNPLAAASIAQLHLARLHSGERVVVKIKYPGIEEAIRSDLKIVGALASLLSKRLYVANMPELLEEVSSLIIGECDFLAEASNQEFFRNAFANDPDVVIPRVMATHSTRDVITMEYIEGKSFAEFQAAASREQKNRSAEIIARVAVVSIHRLCIFNGDPHPGNYLFLADGRVAFLDFGFCRRWSPEFINLSKRQALAAVENDPETFAAMTRRIGYEFEAPEAYREVLDLMRAGPFAPWLEDRPFRFTRGFIRSELGRMADFYRRFGPVRLSPQELAVQRVVWGHHGLFADLEAEFNAHQMVMPYLRTPIPENNKERLAD